MRVDLALLADYAEVTQRGGKLIVCGIFDRITLADTEAAHPHMALALKLACDVGEDPVHHLTVRLVDPDGVDVVTPMEGEVEVKGETEAEASVNLILDLNLVRFASRGPHSGFWSGRSRSPSSNWVPRTAKDAGRQRPPAGDPAPSSAPGGSTCTTTSVSCGYLVRRAVSTAWAISCPRWTVVSGATST